MSDQWTDRLSAYLDGELPDEERTELELHLANCGECRTVLAQLEGVIAWAERYPGREPAQDAWPVISAAIGKSEPGVVSIENRRPRRRLSLSLPQALAAGMALAVVGVGSWWTARATAPEDRMAAVIDASTLDAGFTITPAIHAAQKYGPAIEELERVLVEQQSTLDSSTVRVLLQKVVIIDRALAEAQDALARDPASDYLADHYTGMMKKKLSVLRAATRTAAVQS